MHLEDVVAEKVLNKSKNSLEEQKNYIFAYSSIFNPVLYYNINLAQNTFGGCNPVYASCLPQGSSGSGVSCGSSDRKEGSTGGGSTSRGISTLRSEPICRYCPLQCCA